MLDPFKRQAKYRSKQGDRGQVRVSLWIPEDKVEDIKRIAKAMRKNRDY